MKNEALILIEYTSPEFLIHLRRVLNRWSLDNPDDFSYKTYVEPLDDKERDN